jgi:hypothetical protein
VQLKIEFKIILDVISKFFKKEFDLLEKLRKQRIFFNLNDFAKLIKHFLKKFYFYQE